jgi:hypothetical protein
MVGAQLTAAKHGRTEFCNREKQDDHEYGQGDKFG